ncbi:facilitated trehalose transporter Tret1-2 homolog, partial [Sitophilus oryzae]|uniref:Facilitated trehalose transporter Tret1-2 homolog n=1 Tax=Sitophilus oryzae TaxID=7048 RepID=A0A6J2XSD6_SITOR
YSLNISIVWFCIFYLLNILLYYFSICYLNKHFTNIFFISVNLITFSGGGSWSWTSPMIPKLSSTDPEINPLPKPTTTFEESWIAALMNLGAVIGPFAGGACAGKFGKKKALLIMALPMMASHILCTIALNVYFFLAARFLMGLGVGTIFAVVPAYVGDIAEDRNRGTLCSVLGVCNSLGILLMYIVGPFLSVRLFNFLNIIPLALFYIIFGYFMPDSPYDAVKKGNRTYAEEILMKLRGKSSGDVEKELLYITEIIEANSNSVDNGLSAILKSKSLTKGLIISNGLMLFQQLSGICAVLGYMQSIFEVSGSSIPPIYSAMIIGTVQLISNSASAQLVDVAGRKMLLIISHVFSGISLVALGAYFFLKQLDQNVDFLGWLPITSLVIFIISYNLGLANMPWVVLSELFPSNVKAIASVITSFSCFFLSFVITMCFPFLSASLGMAGSFWVFAIFLTCGFVFCITLLPETKGKSVLEIKNILDGVKK